MTLHTILKSVACKNCGKVWKLPVTVREPIICCKGINTASPRCKHLGEVVRSVDGTCTQCIKVHQCLLLNKECIPSGANPKNPDEASACVRCNSCPSKELA